LQQALEKQESELQNLYETWELIAGVHGVPIKIPFLEEKRHKQRIKEHRNKKPVPLHIQMMKAGMKVQEK